jgi:uncharacterized protein
MQFEAGDVSGKDFRPQRPNAFVFGVVNVLSTIRAPYMIHPNSELRFVSPIIGSGVFATRFIPQGTITWVGDPLDQVISDEVACGFGPLVSQVLEKYSYKNRKGERILCWDHARFVNHSCNPTCLAPGFDFEIAVRDILAGEEITDDYGTLNLEEDMICGCGSPNCRRILRRNDFLLYGAQWDALVSKAFWRLREVEQPLWELVQQKAAVNRVLEGTVPLPSCLLHYYEIHSEKPAIAGHSGD